MPITIAAVALLPVIAISLIGDYYVKLAAVGRGFSAPAFYFGALFYAATAVGMMVAMRHMSLATVGVWYAILTVLTMTALGVFVFKEPISGREVAGIGFSFAALICMSRFA